MAAKKKAKTRKAPPAKAQHPALEKGEAKLSARPIWQGHLRLSLVSCPVSLYGATSRSNDVSFHLLNPKTNNRIRMIPTDPDTGPVERADLVKGYEIEKNHYVIVTPKELDAVKLETTHTIDIERFVDANDIDRLFWSTPYYLVPNEKTGLDAYTVIRDALVQTGRIALGPRGDAFARRAARGARAARQGHRARRHCACATRSPIPRRPSTTSPPPSPISA